MAGQKRPAQKWAAPIPSHPKSHNHCAEVLGTGRWPVLALGGGPTSPSELASFRIGALGLFRQTSTPTSVRISAG